MSGYSVNNKANIFWKLISPIYLDRYDVEGMTTRNTVFNVQWHMSYSDSIHSTSHSTGQIQASVTSWNVIIIKCIVVDISSRFNFPIYAWTKWRDCHRYIWRHQIEPFSASLSICGGIHRSPVSSPHKGQWHGAPMFSLVCVWINGWVNNREAGDLRRYRGH